MTGSSTSSRCGSVAALCLTWLFDASHVLILRAGSSLQCRDYLVQIHYTVHTDIRDPGTRRTHIQAYTSPITSGWMAWSELTLCLYTSSCSFYVTHLLPRGLIQLITMPSID